MHVSKFFLPRIYKLPSTSESAWQWMTMASALLSPSSVHALIRSSRAPRLQSDNEANLSWIINSICIDQFKSVSTFADGLYIGVLHHQSLTHAVEQSARLRHQRRPHAITPAMRFLYQDLPPNGCLSAVLSPSIFMSQWRRVPCPFGRKIARRSGRAGTATASSEVSPEPRRKRRTFPPVPLTCVRLEEVRWSQSQIAEKYTCTVISLCLHQVATGEGPTLTEPGLWVGVRPTEAHDLCAVLGRSLNSLWP